MSPKDKDRENIELSNYGDLFKLAYEYNTLEELIEAASNFPDTPPPADATANAKDIYQGSKDAWVFLERSLDQIEADEDAGKETIRLIREPGDSAYMVFERTLAELNREKEELATSMGYISPETKERLNNCTLDSIESMKVLDKLLNDINMKIAEETLGRRKRDVDSITLTNLTRVPEQLITRLQEYPNLSWLTIHQGYFSRLPESLCNLVNLEYLKLSKNCLTMLPESLGNLKRLKKLFLQVNQLLSLPESIGDLEALEELDLAGNQLESLPESFGNLQALRELNLEHNQFTTPPAEAIDHLEALRTLRFEESSMRRGPLLPQHGSAAAAAHRKSKKEDSSASIKPRKK